MGGGGFSRCCNRLSAFFFSWSDVRPALRLSSLEAPCQRPKQLAVFSYSALLHWDGCHRRKMRSDQLEQHLASFCSHSGHYNFSLPSASWKMPLPPLSC